MIYRIGFTLAPTQTVTPMLSIDPKERNHIIKSPERAAQLVARGESRYDPDSARDCLLTLTLTLTVR